MESAVDEKVQLVNKLARALAKEEGITVTEALVKIKSQFMDREETADTIRGLSMQQPGNYHGGNGRDPSTTNFAIEAQAKVEQKRLDIEQRRLETEQKRLDIEQRKQELAEKKIETDAQIQREKLDREDKYRQDQLALERTRQHEDANFNRQLLLMGLGGGKKSDETIEFLKSQAQSTADFYKAQGQSTKDMYDTVFKAQESQKDRELTWRTELARIEAERDKELAKYRQENESSTATQTEALIQMLGDKFERFLENNKGGTQDDFMKKMEDYSKMQKTMVSTTLSILESQGWDPEKLKPIKDAVTSEEKRQESTLGKLFKLGGKLIKELEPTIDTLNAAPSPPKIQSAPAAQPSISPEEEQRIRQETALKAQQLQNENAQLKQEYEDEKKRIEVWKNERSQLQAIADQLGLYYDDNVTNEQLLTMIEQEEARRSQAAAQAQFQQQVIVPETPQPPVVPVAAPPESPQAPATITQPEQQLQQLRDQVYETSPETEQFITSMNQEEQKTPPVRTRNRSSRNTRQTFKVCKEDGTIIAEVEAANHRGAAMKAIKDVKPAEPLSVIVMGDEGEKPYSCSIENGKPIVRNPPTMRKWKK